MDRNLKALESAPASSWARVVAAGVSAVFVMLVSSLFLRISPSEGYRAGFESVTAQWNSWVSVKVHSAGTSLTSCEELYRQVSVVFAEDYSDFVEGCSDGVDHLAGRHVPLLHDLG